MLGGRRSSARTFPPSAPAPSAVAGDRRRSAAGRGGVGDRGSFAAGPRTGWTDPEKRGGLCRPRVRHGRVGRPGRAPPCRRFPSVVGPPRPRPGCPRGARANPADRRLARRRRRRAGAAGDAAGLAVGCRRRHRRAGGRRRHRRRWHLVVDLGGPVGRMLPSSPYAAGDRGVRGRRVTIGRRRVARWRRGRGDRSPDRRIGSGRAGGVGGRQRRRPAAGGTDRRGERGRRGGSRPAVAQWLGPGERLRRDVGRTAVGPAEDRTVAPVAIAPGSPLGSGFGRDRDRGGPSRGEWTPCVDAVDAGWNGTAASGSSATPPPVDCLDPRGPTAVAGAGTAGRGRGGGGASERRLTVSGGGSGRAGLGRWRVAPIFRLWHVTCVAGRADYVAAATAPAHRAGYALRRRRGWGRAGALVGTGCPG